MFERFTDRARRVIVLAQEAARVEKSEAIGVDHLLVGLIDEGQGVAFVTLEATGIDVSALREALIAGLKPNPTLSEGLSGHIPFTRRARKTIELGLREALQLGHAYVGTEHLLLAIMREGESRGAQIMAEMGATETGVRRQVLAILSTGKPYAGELTNSDGEPYPKIVQTFLKRLTERVVVDPSLREHLVTMLETVADDRAKQARHALRKDVRAYLDLLVD